MKVGTKSLLFGAHQVVIHPLIVAESWRRLYGFPTDPRLWIAFIVHDWGYWGKPNMDGPEGETHVILGAYIMSFFGRDWMRFALYHSRFYAKMNRQPVSRLCIADKLSLVVIPKWLYKLLVILSGEGKEYQAIRRQPNGKYRDEVAGRPEDWIDNMREYVTRWVLVHKDGEVDTWTKLERD